MPRPAAIQDFMKRLRGSLLAPADPNYDVARRVWNGPKLLGSFPRKNPMSGKIEKKLAYWERKDDLIFKAGTYEAG
jgi:hypothetical protein